MRATRRASEGGGQHAERVRSEAAELLVHGWIHAGCAGSIPSWRGTARLDGGDADTFVSAFSPRAVATAPVVADT